MNKHHKISGDLAPDPVSSVDLFAGAIFPGFILVIFYVFWILICTLFKPENFPHSEKIKKK